MKEVNDVLKTIVVLILLSSILSSCQLGMQKPPEVLISDSEKQLMFFSDEENLHNEANYYDALLELKKEYPEEISNMKVIPLKENNRYSHFNIQSYPTLLIIENNIIIEQIDGMNQTELIISTIENALSNKKKSP